MRCGAFGDIVLLTVLLEQLHARFGKPVDLIASGPWTLPLLEGFPGLGRVFLLRSRRTPWWLSWQQRRLVRWLRARGAGPTWFCDLGAGRDLLRRAAIPDDYVVDSRHFPWVPGESFADRYLRLGSYTPSAFTGLLPPAVAGVARAARLVVGAAERQRLDDWLAGRALGGRALTVFHPGSRHMARRPLRPRSASKYWPPANWAQVVRAVRQHAPGEAIVFSGTRAESGFIEEIMQLADAPDLHNCAGELPIRRLLPLLERAAGLISVDTGPAHAAAALGCPTVSLFGTADAALYRPGGATTPAVALTGTVNGAQNILGITPERVIAAWLALRAQDFAAQDNFVKSVKSDRTGP
jgi:heptosyltransferase-2/heptosyltransferase-3